MPKQSISLKHFESIRSDLNIDASDRVRLALSLGDEGLSIELECVVCGDLLEWVASKQLWSCPECHQDTTDQEAAAFVRACYGALETVLSVSDEGKVRRWLRERMGI